jgi:hypothetical protein
MTGTLDFTFSDLVAGYIRKVDFPEVFDSQGFIELETSDGRTFTVKVTYTCYAELVRNLGEGFQVAPGLKETLTVGRFIHAYGVFYPEANGLKFEAKHILLFGRDGSKLRFEEQDWWVRQIQQLLNFYLEKQFKVEIEEHRCFDFFVSIRLSHVADFDEWRRRILHGGSYASYKNSVYNLKKVLLM